MSSKKITAADKLEIVDLYRNAEDTTASLATRYGVSNSTISRLLKTSIPEAEYEVLIQQKRVVKVLDEAEDLSAMATAAIAAATDRSRSQPQPDLAATPSSAVPAIAPPQSIATAEDSSVNRRLRRRSSAPVSIASDEPTENLARPPIELESPLIKTPAPSSSEETISASENIDLRTTTPPVKVSLPAPIPRTPVLREILSDSENRYFTPVIEPSSVAEDLEEDEDENTEDVNVLAAMFGEEVADSEDDDDEDEDDDDEEESSTSTRLLDPNQLLTGDRLHVQITPLSQATLPRTCYIVIDKFAELIIRPLKDFADLGQISSEETQQRTLPIFDNHRVAKRFSNQRTQRVIKVPDSRVFYKTTQHLKLKGITRLLVDGNIYSLN
jgi:transposase-like protein